MDAQYSRWVDGKDRGPAPGSGLREAWTRFQTANPLHRPGLAPGTREPCLVHQIALQEPQRACYRCYDEPTRRSLQRMLDHPEPWHYAKEGDVRNVLFGHPYEFDPPLGCSLTHELLKTLPAEWSQQIAIYHGSDAGSWYVAGCPGLLIQNIELPPIVGWWRVTRARNEEPR